MKSLVRSIAFAALVGSVLMMPDRVLSVSLDQHTMSGAAAPHVAGEVLVKFRPTATTRSREVSLAAQGHTMLADLDQGGWTLVRLGAGETVDQALGDYRNDPNVEYVQPNYIYHIALVPSDPQYGQLWAFKNTGQTITNAFTQPPASSLTYTTNNPPPASGNDMNIEKAWGQITDCSSMVVAVVDTGVNYNHADLAGNMWSSATYTNHGFNYVDNNSDPMDRNGHGTHVAGIIGAAGNNGVGTTGVCWTASIMAVRVLDASGSGTTANIIQGINFAVSNGAKVINMSLGGGGPLDAAFSSAITAAQTADVVVVVAAGNSATNNDAAPMYPCNFTQPNLVCVAALDQNYQLAAFSNYGATSVDVGAPGTNILSAWTGTNAVITDSLTGWTSTTTTGGGWAPGTLSLVGGASINALLDPATYPNGQYNTNTDDRTYKVFNLTGVDVAVVQGYAAVNVVNNDFFRIGYSGTGGDPFSGGTVVSNVTNMATYPNLVFESFDISRCIGANCSIGFQLKSAVSSAADRGVAIAGFSIETIAMNTTSYNTINGTSMATPEVAGLAAMLRAYNPLFTYIDVVNAIKNGGRAAASLSGRTSTGKAIDVMSSLAYINPPGGLSAVVQ